MNKLPRPLALTLNEVRTLILSHLANVEEVDTYEPFKPILFLLYRSVGMKWESPLRMTHWTRLAFFCLRLTTQSTAITTTATMTAIRKSNKPTANNATEGMLAPKIAVYSTRNNVMIADKYVHTTYSGPSFIRTSLIWRLGLSGHQIFQE